MSTPGLFDVRDNALNIRVIRKLPIVLKPFFVDPGFDIHEKVRYFVPENVNRRDGGGNRDESANRID